MCDFLATSRVLLINSGSLKNGYIKCLIENYSNMLLFIYTMES